MAKLKLFVMACFLGGVGGAAGSMLGHSFGSRGLWTGGILGGLLAAVLVARLAAWRRWIRQPAMRSTAIGAAVGFLAAAAVVTQTLSSPVGPIASTLLIGAGAVLGATIVRQNEHEP
jgi:hypothetical protein